MSNPIHAAGSMSYDEFFEAFGPDDFGYVSPSTQQTTLSGALSNPDPEARYSIANRLLDEGVDPAYVTNASTNALHAAFGARKRDYQALALLVRRLLDGGADPNLASPEFGTPLQMVADFINAREEALIPIYDAFFSRDDLDLLTPAAFNQSTLSLARKSREFLPELVRRMEQYLSERGIDAPQEGQA